MNTAAPKILFMHGLDSSRESLKFHALHSSAKICINVDYRNLNYLAVKSFYCEMIEKIQPEILVGHGLGGYWALKMSLKYHLPAVVANPSLSPSFNQQYPAIRDEELEHDIAQMAYLELGDEILDMHQIQDRLESFMPIVSIKDGRHQLEYPDRLNELIQQIQLQIDALAGSHK